VDSRGNGTSHILTAKGDERTAKGGSFGPEL